MSLLTLSSGVRTPPLIPRAPLPPFPPCGSCPSPFAYDQTLPAPLSWTDPKIMRADFTGVTIPGLPFVTGGSSIHPERCLSWFLDRWTADWQQRIVNTHAGYRYRNFVLSVPDSCNGPSGLSLPAFVALCDRPKMVGLRVTAFLGSKLYQPHDMSVDQWIAYVDPILDAILPTVDEVVPGWEWNLWNIPGAPTLGAIKHIGARAHAVGKLCFLHFSTEVTSWYANGDPRGRFGFWDDLGANVDGLLYQGDSAWDIGQLQSRMVDTLNQFAVQGHGHVLRAFELKASAMFDGDHPTEDEANVFGYLACCTRAAQPVAGFGNGGRYPDGTPL